MVIVTVVGVLAPDFAFPEALVDASVDLWRPPDLTAEYMSKRDYWMAAYRHTAIDGKPTQGIVRGPRVNKEHLVQYWIRLPLGDEEGRSVKMILCLDYFLSAMDDEQRQANSA